MKSNISAIPSGYRSVTPYLTINNAAGAIEFYKKAFGATEVMRFEGPHGKIGHAELKIGDSLIMLGDTFAEGNATSASTSSHASIAIHLYIPDVDAVIQQAVTAGAKMINQAEDKFYGDRSGMIEDPYGITWCISTHVQDLSADEVNERAKIEGVKLVDLVLPGPRHL